MENNLTIEHLRRHHFQTDNRLIAWQLNLVEIRRRNSRFHSKNFEIDSASNYFRYYVPNLSNFNALRQKGTSHKRLYYVGSR